MKSGILQNLHVETVDRAIETAAKKRAVAAEESSVEKDLLTQVKFKSVGFDRDFYHAVYGCDGEFPAM